MNYTIYQKISIVILYVVFPWGSLPFVFNIPTSYNIPLIIHRLERKVYGMNKQIEGYEDNKIGRRCLIVEDVITTCGSIKDIISIIKGKVEMVGIISIVNRNKNLKEIDNYKIEYLFGGQ